VRSLRFLCLLLFFASLVSCSTLSSGAVVQAEDYFSIATAYFELGKYAEAERWFSMATRYEKTRFASEYNLGRVAFARGDAEEAAKRFESLLKHDPQNTTVLKAAAYSWMKVENWDRALSLYARLGDLLPETEDARYNFALALSSASRYAEAFEKLKPFVERNPDDRDALRLLAGIEKNLGMPEAADLYAKVLQLKDDASVRMEFGEFLESSALYARALENYKAILSSLSADGVGGKGTVRFRIARVMLLGGEDPEKCLVELTGAVSDGFADAKAIRALAEMSGISDDLREQILAAALDVERKKAKSVAPALAPDAAKQP